MGEFLLGFLIMFVVILVLYFTIRFVWIKIFGGHNWFYRNPFDRRCKKCGYREVMFETINGDKWEPMNEYIKIPFCYFRSKDEWSKNND